MTHIAGIDGCPAGWLRVEQDIGAGCLVARTFARASELFADADRFVALAIDIPIGLSEKDPRGCDVAARRLLRAPRASSVFPAPIRAALDAPTYADASARSMAVCGKRMSKQAYAIVPKIADVDAQLQGRPELRGRVREVHPEVCFMQLAGHPMAHAKRSAAGARERDRLLAGAFGDDAFAAIRRELPRSAAADDDIRDALVALWTAGRIAGGQAIAIPPVPARDATGLPMEMVV